MMENPLSILLQATGLCFFIFYLKYPASVLFGAAQGGAGAAAGAGAVGNAVCRVLYHRAVAQLHTAGDIAAVGYISVVVRGGKYPFPDLNVCFAPFRGLIAAGEIQMQPYIGIQLAQPDNGDRRDRVKADRAARDKIRDPVVFDQIYAYLFYRITDMHLLIIRYYSMSCEKTGFILVMHY